MKYLKIPIFLSLALTMGSIVLSAETRPPNFVYILTDDISAEDISLYGNQLIDTPNLERMAMRGLVFDNAYLTTSSCSPSRISMITGRYLHNTGDNIPNNPTPHKATLDGELMEWERREMLGDATAAYLINHPGPIGTDYNLIELIR